MTVIAFRPRRRGDGRRWAVSHTSVTGTFQSPRGRSGQMEGILRVGAIRLVPGGACIDGVFTAELREVDGTVIGVDSRRATVDADVVRGDAGPRLVVAPLELDLMGLTVLVGRFTVEHPRMPPPRSIVGERSWPPGRHGTAGSC